MRTRRGLSLDAWVAIGIAALVSLSLSLASKESYEYVNAYARFYLLMIVGMLVQAGHALAKFRDDKYTRQQEHDRRQIEADKTGVPSTIIDTVMPDKTVAPSTGNAVDPKA